MNYKKVIEDFNSGVLKRDRFQVVVDNDGGYWSCLDESINVEAREYLAEKMSQKYGDPDGYRDVVDILKAAGVNADWC